MPDDNMTICSEVSDIVQIDGNVSLNTSINSVSSKSDQSCSPSSENRIPVIVSNRGPKKPPQNRKPCNNVTIKRSNKLLTAVQLPVVVNLNPRSIYNKADEFKTMMEQLDVGVCFMSESWDRQSLGLSEVIGMEGYRIVKNVKQRSGQGGKPALIISEKDYFIKELCPDEFSVPPNVEAAWAMLTPKAGGKKGHVKHIAVCSYYYTVKTKRSEFVDHVSEVFNLLSAKYGPGLHFILAGDTNRLNLKSILNLSPNLKQVVSVPTRNNPDAILDTIITTLPMYYQCPVTLPPLDNDSDNNGKPSDHLIVYMPPISAGVPKKKLYKYVTFRPLPESGLLQFAEWIRAEKWETIFQATTAHEKAANLQYLVLQKLNEFLPLKTSKICSEDEPWFNFKLKKLDRKRKREYIKHKKSKKWQYLNSKFEEKCSEEKEKYYINIVEDLKTSQPGQWYSKLKRMSSHDQAKTEEPIVQSLNDLPDQTQAEEIANQFSHIANLYEPLKSEDICLDGIQNSKPYPCLEPHFVHKKIKSMKSNTATLKNDVPMKVIKMFSYEFSFPLSHIYKRCCRFGEYPNLWKLETVTPVPKKYPPETPEQLRKISGTLNFSKIFEKFLAEAIVLDMAPNSDPSQYGNEKGISTQHYLIKMINQILTYLDTNNDKEAYGVIVQLIDWSQAFDRQCPTLGIKSFVKNGVRKSIIPVLANYFQDRKMQVKWHGTLSSTRDLPGGGPQGCYLGQQEYQSQSNDSGHCVDAKDRFKFVDDMSLLEVVNLLACGLSSYNFKNHVASDIAVGSSYLPPENIKSQAHLDSVQQWTEENQMLLNKKKSNVMLFNYTKNYQFCTRLYIGDSLLETVNQTKLLGSIISSDLTWWANTNMITTKAYQRLELIKKLYEFNVPLADLTHIYTLYVRSILEFNCCVWHFGITKTESEDIERVQKIACKIILKENYTTYEDALARLGIQNLEERRLMLCTRFAKKCLKFDKSKDMFPSSYPNTRHEVFKVNFAKTSRLKDSAIPMMQRTLNSV